jgi:hypothetical protein
MEVLLLMIGLNGDTCEGGDRFAFAEIVHPSFLGYGVGGK